jgi:hypothetical protein
LHPIVSLSFAFWLRQSLNYKRSAEEYNNSVVWYLLFFAGLARLSDVIGELWLHPIKRTRVLYFVIRCTYNTVPDNETF